MLNSTEYENLNCSYKQKYRQIKKFLGLSLLGVVFIMLINVKMPTIVGILTLLSRINSVLNTVEYEKKFFILGVVSSKKRNLFSFYIWTSI